MEILLLIFLLLLSAFFSGSETGLTSSSPAKLQKLKSKGDKRADIVSKLHKKEDELIGSILLGNNAVNIGASALATSITIEYFGQAGIIYTTIIMTFMVLIFAEVMPKTYAFRNPERVALRVAPIFSIIVKIFAPITRLVQLLVNYIFKKFNIQTSKTFVAAKDEIRGAIELQHNEGSMVKDERDMLGGILDLSEAEISEIMIHRKEIYVIDGDMASRDIIAKIASSRFTRVPIYKDNPDNIIGILHSKTLLKAVEEFGIDNVNIAALTTEPWFVPETRKLKNQLHAFRSRKNHFAMVVDEYGAVMGVVTLEDILEEIVGQIDDEHDATKQSIRLTRSGSYFIAGDATIRDINRELEWNLPDDIATTIAGLIIHQAEIIPDIKQVFSFSNIRFEITKKDRNRIMQIKAKPLLGEEA